MKAIQVELDESGEEDELETLKSKVMNANMGSRRYPGGDIAIG